MRVAEGVPLRLFVVNHCEARDQVEERVGGWQDSELSGLGVRQAKALGLQLQRIFESSPRSPQLFSSDLCRARETAEHIALAVGTDVRLRLELRPMGCGEAEGRPRSWLAENAQPLPETGDLLHYRCASGAESMHELSQRVYPFIAELAERDDAEIILVTHRGTHDMVVGAWLGAPQESLGRYALCTTPGGITELRTNPRTGVRVLASLNDTGHLVGEIVIDTD